MNLQKTHIRNIGFCRNTIWSNSLRAKCEIFSFGRITLCETFSALKRQRAKHSILPFSNVWNPEKSKCDIFRIFSLAKTFYTNIQLLSKRNMCESKCSTCDIFSFAGIFYTSIQFFPKNNMCEIQQSNCDILSFDEIYSTQTFSFQNCGTKCLPKSKVRKSHLHILHYEHFISSGDGHDHVQAFAHYCY